MNERLVVQGAREHNLRNVDLDLPRDKLIVFTGLSGSGKSSLAFDTIFAEGQRRYVESLSAYARQFLGQMDKPDVDFIEGLSPAVSIDQKSTNRNPRSTVGTITEVYDYLRLLFARAGTQYCPICGERVTAQTPQQIVDRLLELPEGTRYQVLAPVVRGRKGEYADLFKELQSKGFARARVDGEVVQLTEPPTLEKKLKHDIEVVIDRLVAREGVQRRLTDSVETALGLAGGLLVVELVDADIDDLEPRAPVLRAPRVPERPRAGARRDRAAHVLVQRARTARAPSAPASARGSRSTRTWWSRTRTCRSTRARSRRGRRSPASTSRRVLSALASDMGFSTSVPWRALPQRAKDAVLHGQNHEVKVRYKNRWGRERQYSTGLRGRHHVPRAPAQRDRLGLEQGEVRGLHARGPVPGVRGCAAQARGARGAGRRPVDRRGLRPAHPRGARRSSTASSWASASARSPTQVLKEIQARLGFLLDVGLDYLSLTRPAGDAVRRRGAAHPARDADRLRPGRRALRPRRAEHRPAPARQPAPDRHAHAPARPGQHAHRRRARRGHHPHGRLDRRHRPGRR